jgi:hypothetical protein
VTQAIYYCGVAAGAVEDGIALLPLFGFWRYDGVTFALLHCWLFSGTDDVWFTISSTVDGYGYYVRATLRGAPAADAELLCPRRVNVTTPVVLPVAERSTQHAMFLTYADCGRKLRLAARLPTARRWFVSALRYSDVERLLLYQRTREPAFSPDATVLPWRTAAG